MIASWVSAFEMCGNYESFTAMEINFVEKDTTFMFFYREKSFAFFQVNGPLGDEKSFKTKEELLENVKSSIKEYGEINKISIKGYNGTEAIVYQKN